MIQKKGKRKNSVIFHIDLPQEIADAEKYFFRTGSQEFLEEGKDAESTGCCRVCRCCTRFCMPCRRMRCSRCCRRHQPKSGDDSEQPVLSATSSTTTTNLEVIDERQRTRTAKTSCWQKLNCCKRCRKKKSDVEEMVAAESAAMQAMTPPAAAAITPKQSKCGRCLSKVFCCRTVNRVEATGSGDDEVEMKRCCFCIPCGRKKVRASAAGAASTAGAAAWQDPERGIIATDASVLEGGTPRPGCCKRFWSCFLCCRKKEQPPQPSQSRRASMRAPPPPPEDNRRKLHVDLVEYNSKMKGAIPVLPLYLAWFCLICNTVFPGLGTLLSGFFCICFGIPRFSHYDSAKARIGSLIINIIVSVAQLFCVLFCFVGWGWSIWWGTIMLKCAKKLSKIKKVERLEMEEEQRQADIAAAAATAAKAAMTAETEAATQA